MARTRKSAARGKDVGDIDSNSIDQVGDAADVRRRAARDFGTRWAGLLLTGAVVAVSFIAGLFGPDPNLGDPSNRLQAPSLTSLGTDEAGRDLLLRVLAATRVGIFVSLVAAVAPMIIGGGAGMVAGLVGGRLDTVISRAMDIVFAFPALLLAIIVAAAFGSGLGTSILAISLVFVPRFFRLARSGAISERAKEYVDSARVSRVPTWQIALRHVWPNVLPQLIVMAVLTMAAAQIAYAALSFLGLGIPPPQADFGSMISRGRQLMLIAPWLVVVPGIALTLFILLLSWTGESIRAALGPAGSERDSGRAAGA